MGSEQWHGNCFLRKEHVIPPRCSSGYIYTRAHPRALGMFKVMDGVSGEEGVEKIRPTRYAWAVGGAFGWWPGHRSRDGQMIFLAPGGTDIEMFGSRSHEGTERTNHDYPAGVLILGDPASHGFGRLFHAN